MVTLFAVTAALAIGLTRAYLDLTGYPSIGGKVFHLAHALWGGLLLIIACVLTLALRNRWVAPTAATLGGLGTGLFVDEVGKFITRSNDYFFPLAAPIAYACLIALAYAAYGLGRLRRMTARAHLYAALDLSRAAVDGALTRRQADLVVGHVDSALALEPDPAQRELAMGLRAAALTAAAGPEPVDPSRSDRWQAHLLALESRWLPLDRNRRLLRLALLLSSGASLLGALVSLPLSIYLSIHPELVAVGPVTYRPGPIAFSVAALGALASIIGALLVLAAARALRPNRLDPARAWRRGSLGLVIAMGVANALASYVDQFAVLGGLAVDGVLLAALARWCARAGALGGRSEA